MFSFSLTDQAKIQLMFLQLLCEIGAVILYLSAPATIRLLLGTSSDQGYSISYAVAYLTVISFFYLFCFTGGSFTGLYNGTGKVGLTLAGSTLQISIRVLLSWLLFGSAGLSAVAVATGIGWIRANVFWGICYRIRSSHARP